MNQRGAVATGTVGTDESGNPAFGSAAAKDAFSQRSPKQMTVAGVTIKTLLLLVALVAGGSWGWASATVPVATDFGGGYGNTTVTIPGGFWLASFAALFVGIFLAINPRRAALFGLIYAVLEGYCLGVISASFDAQTDGIVSAAILSTVAVFAVALFLYATRIIKPTQKLAFGVVAGIGGLSLLYLFVWVLSIFNWGFLYSEQFHTIGVVVTIIAVVLAALSLTLDFAFIEASIDGGAPRFLEWYAGFSLMVTLIWLYVSLLRLLALLARNQ
jgi:uncharacterized YccA/Bax inhibitor family protein